MIPVLTPVQLRLVDERAPVPVEQLIGRAGAAVARHAIEVLGGVSKKAAKRFEKEFQALGGIPGQHSTED